MIRHALFLFLSSFILFSCSFRAKEELLVEQIKSMQESIKDTETELTLVKSSYETLLSEYSVLESQYNESVSNRMDTQVSIAELYAATEDIPGVYRFDGINSGLGVRIISMKNFLIFQLVSISENGLSMEVVPSLPIDVVERSIDNHYDISFTLYGTSNYEHQNSYYFALEKSDSGFDGTLSNRFSRDSNKQIDRFKLEKISDNPFIISTILDEPATSNSLIGLYDYANTNEDTFIQILEMESGLVVRRVPTDIRTASPDSLYIPVAFIDKPESRPITFQWQSDKHGLTEDGVVLIQKFELDETDSGLFGSVYMNGSTIGRAMHLEKISDDPYAIP